MTICYIISKALAKPTDIKKKQTFKSNNKQLDQSLNLLTRVNQLLQPTCVADSEL